MGAPLAVEAGETDPHAEAEQETVQFTLALFVPVTVAVNAWVCPAPTLAVCGETVTLTFCVMVIVAEADTELSAADVAVIATVAPAVGRAVGAV